MSVQKVRDAIERLLAKKTPQVLCIRGVWGTGKTYTWNDVLLNAAKAKKVEAEKYGKVSLFGLNSIQEIKREIFQSTRPDRLGKPTPTSRITKTSTRLPDHQLAVQARLASNTTPRMPPSCCFCTAAS